jgi:hypothetical protein
MERGFSEVFSMFGYKEKLGQFFKGPMFWCGNRNFVISNWINCPMFGVEIKAW